MAYNEETPHCAADDQKENRRGDSRQGKRRKWAARYMKKKAKLGKKDQQKLIDNLEKEMKERPGCWISNGRPR